MKKIESTIDICKDCKFLQQFNPQKKGFGKAFICVKSNRLLAMGQSLGNNEIPDWCLLDDYNVFVKGSDMAAGNVEELPEKIEPRTIILPGLPHLEWMTENLSGFGGTEINGRTYYTYDEAVEAVKQLGNGWRLPTRGEMVDLDDLGSTWDDEGPYSMPGRLFGGGLFLEASGYRSLTSGALTGVGTQGGCYSSSPAGAGSAHASGPWFTSSNVNPLGTHHRGSALPVRCVRNRQ